MKDLLFVILFCLIIRPKLKNIIVCIFNKIILFYFLNEYFLYL